MRESTTIFIWGFIGIIMGCIIVKSGDYVYPQVSHWDDRHVCKDNAKTYNMEYIYSAYQDVCRVKYKNTWMTFRNWYSNHSPEALELEKRLQDFIDKSSELYRKQFEEKINK